VALTQVNPNMPAHLNQQPQQHYLNNFFVVKIIMVENPVMVELGQKVVKKDGLM